MLKAGITGGIGSGKSTIAGIFHALGVPVFYSDAEAAKIVQADAHIIKSLKELLGQDIYDRDGNLDRKKMSELIFKDARLLQKINTLIHPAVFSAFDAWCAERKNFPYVMKEAAILFESGSHKGLDYVITVFSPEQMRIERVKESRGLVARQIHSIIKKQWSEEEKIKKADFVIYNNEEEPVIPQVLKLHKKFLDEAAGK